MDHQIAVVEQDPAPVAFALLTQRALVEIVFQVVVNVLDQRLDVAARRTGCDQEEIGENDQFGDIEQDEVEALLIGDDLRRMLGGGYGFCVGGNKPASPCRSSLARS